MRGGLSLTAQRWCRKYPHVTSTWAVEVEPGMAMSSGLGWEIRRSEAAAMQFSGINLEFSGTRRSSSPGHGAKHPRRAANQGPPLRRGQMPRLARQDARRLEASSAAAMPCFVLVLVRTSPPPGCWARSLAQAMAPPSANQIPAGLACRRAAARRLTCIVVLYLRRHRHEDMRSSFFPSSTIHPPSPFYQFALLQSAFPLSSLCLSYISPFLSISPIKHLRFPFPNSGSQFSVVSFLGLLFSVLIFFFS